MFLIRDTDFAGVTFSSATSEAVPFEGTVTGSGPNRMVDGTGGDTGVFELTIGGTYNTLSGQSSGTWDTNDIAGGNIMDSGTWSAGPCP